MKVAFCYENVIPSKGGCETYIATLARRLLADGHEVRVYACRWDEAALPKGIRYYPLPPRRVPRFLRPWRFTRLCQKALEGADHDVSIGFDKTWGQEVLYPQGGLHAASVRYNLDKYGSKLMRGLAHICRQLDLAHWSFSRLERRQYLGPEQPMIVVNSEMVRRHFKEHYGVSGSRVHVIPSAIDHSRFVERDRPKVRLENRTRLGLGPADVVGVFAAMNYRLKGLAPLLHAVARLCEDPRYEPGPENFRLLVAGGPRYGAYERLARRLGVVDRVRFLGHCKDMKGCYFASDFLVHPTFYDTCSLVVLEAMSCGLPVITTRSSGASEFLHPLQEGYVIDNPHDHDRLAWCMAQLLDPTRRQLFGAAAKRTAAAWTFEHHYRKMLAVLMEAALRRKAGLIAPRPLAAGA